MKKFPYIFLTVLIPFALQSCGNSNNKTDTQNNTNLQQQSHQVQQHYDMKVINTNPESVGKCGDSFHLYISALPTDSIVNFDSITVTVDGKETAILQNGDTTLTIETKDLRCGRIPISAKISLSSGSNEYLSKTLVLHSDIVPKNKKYKIIKTFNHDKEAYTQGLVVEDNFLYESTGLEKRSSLRKIEISRGDVIQSVGLEDEYFGEGLAIIGDKLIQLTWRNHKGFVYDKKTFARIQDFPLATEGWGLTAISADTLALTDGSNNIYFLESNAFSTLGSIQVYDNVGPVIYLNETEMYNGNILANIYHSDLIAEIDYHTGKVLSYIDLTGILPDNLRNQKTDVLNGIAYNPQKDALYVTGKNWPQLYQIKIVD